VRSRPTSRIFSHGSLNSPLEYALTLEHIASHGYVVVGAWYNGDTQDDVRVQFINATDRSKVLDCLDNLPPPCVDPPAKNVADRARDLSAVLDTLPVAFGENVDMNQVVAMGHSRGTVTSLGAAGGSAFFEFAAEPRVKAVLGFAAAMPALIFNINLSAITVPLSLLLVRLI
jgi:predicted dienelactone hydrolase